MINKNIYILMSQVPANMVEIPFGTRSVNFYGHIPAASGAARGTGEIAVIFLFVHNQIYR